MSQTSLAHPSHRIRGIALAAGALAATLGGATLVAASSPGPAYLAVDDWSARALNGNVVRLSATTDGSVPLRPDAFISDNVIVGIGWADLGTGTALVATIHPVLGRDSAQRPDAWHLHTVQLAGGATAPNDFCLVAVLSTPTAGIAIRGSTMTVNLNASSMPDAGNGPIAASAIDAAVGFTVHPNDDGCATGLGVRIRT
ncbi:MAG TPA: hypothetical protein VFO05_01675 [Candidatus Limnocylindrales bacterium]|nr:hypothetical protein [Candidatus Limnocylindrales bacterium]